MLLPKSLKKIFLPSLWLSLIILAGLWLRLHTLGMRDFWYDEVCAIREAQALFTLPYPLKSTAPIGLPVFTLILHYWIKLFGVSEFAVRLLPLLFSFGSLPLIYILGRKLFNARVGIYATFFMAFSPFHLWYAQEARSYSLMVFCALLSSYILYLAQSGRKIKFYIGYILITLLGVYSNYYYFPLFIAQLFYLSISFKRKYINPGRLLYCVLILFAVLPWLTGYFSRLQFILQGVHAWWWVPSPSFYSLPITLGNFNLGYNLPLAAYFFSGALTVIIAAKAVFMINRIKSRWQNFIFCLLQFIGPFILLYLFSKAIFPIYVDRGLLSATPYFYLILALGIEAVSSRKFKALLLGSFCFLLLWGDFAYFNDQMPLAEKYHLGAFLKKPFRPLVRFLEANFREGDLVGVTNVNPPLGASIKFYTVRNDIKYYLFMEDEEVRRVIGYSLKNDKVFWSSQRKPAWADTPGSYLKLEDLGRLRFNRIWIISAEGGARSGGIDKNSEMVKNGLSSRFHLEFSQDFDGIILFRYSKPK